MRVASTGLAGLLLAVVLAGCATAGSAQTGVGGGSPSAPVSGSSEVDRAGACPQQTPAHLAGRGAGVTNAYICARESRPVPGDGVWMFEVVRRVSGGLDVLLQAYAVPDAAPVPDIACAAVAYDPLVVHLHGPRGTEAVRAPVDACGAPLRQARAAYDSLVTTVVAERADARIQSQLSVDTQCPESFKDVLAISEHDGPAGARNGVSPTPLADPVSVCTYRVGTDADGLRIGHLDGHRVLTGDRLRALNAALARVRRDPGCSRSEQRRFAVLAMGTGQETVVALDGCAVSQGADWWRADSQLRRAAGG
jgi:hypothetical protein